MKIRVVLRHHTVARLHDCNVFLWITLLQVQRHLNSNGTATDKYDGMRFLCFSLVISQEADRWALLVTGHHGRRCETSSCRNHEVVEWNFLLAFEGAINVYTVCLHTCDTSGYNSVVGAVGNVFERPGVGDESFFLMARDDSESRLDNCRQ